MINYVIILSGVLATLYFYATRTFKYWEKRGITYDKPIPFFGNVAANVFAKKSMPQLVEELYWKYPDEKAVGYYKFSHPELLIRDPDIFKRVLTTDFHSFYARGLLETESDHRKLETLRKNLFVVEGDVWRMLRNTMSPAFSSGKLQAMFPLIVERAERLQERTRTFSAAAQPVDARNLMARYTIDFIAACAVGIDTDSQTKEHSDFCQLCLRIFQVGIKDFIVDWLKPLFPSTFKNFKHLARVEKEFCGLIREILRQRNYKPSDKNDFMDSMLAIQVKGKIECESMENMKPNGTPEHVFLEIDEDLIAAQVFLFFGAGYETSSSATSYTLHELAYNPQEQKKVQADIDRVLAKHNNKLSYDAIKEMHYLEWALKEGMRILPPAGHLVRICRRKCSFPDLGVTLNEGTRVTISASALHTDPRYWDSPYEFRPERFSPEINEPKHKFAYLPFGIGPRACLGERMGMIQSLAGLAAILSQFSVAPAPTSVRRPMIEPRSNLVQNIRGGLPLIFTPRTS